VIFSALPLIFFSKKKPLHSLWLRNQNRIAVGKKYRNKVFDPNDLKLKRMIVLRSSANLVEVEKL
jgi:hypothetical protein